MVVDAVMLLDELLPLNMIGIKKVPGGALEVKLLKQYAMKAKSDLFHAFRTHFS